MKNRPKLLSEVTRLTGGQLYEIERIDNLETTFSPSSESSARDIFLSYSPTRTTAGGWHTLDVRVKRRGPTVKARPGYFGGP